MAATSPSAVASSASAMPGATTARFVVCAFEMPMKLSMMPQTVPNKPTKGAVIARNLSPRRHFDPFRLPGDAFLQAIGAQIGGKPDLVCRGLHKLRHRTGGGAQL